MTNSFALRLRERGDVRGGGVCGKVDSPEGTKTESTYPAREICPVPAASCRSYSLDRVTCANYSLCVTTDRAEVLRAGPVPEDYRHLNLERNQNGSSIAFSARQKLSCGNLNGNETIRHFYRRPFLMVDAPATAETFSGR